MILNSYHFSSNPLQTLITIASVLAITGCASNGGYRNSTDGGYGKTATPAPVAAPASNSINPPLFAIDTAIGKVLAGGTEQKTLYFFDKDTPNTSVCYDGCATAWPPFQVTDLSLATDSLTAIARDDGGAQWAISGKPLYFWAGDQKSGDTTGSVVPDWTVATPDDL